MQSVRGTLGTEQEWSQCRSCWFREIRYHAQREAWDRRQSYSLENDTKFTDAAWDFTGYGKGRDDQTSPSESATVDPTKTRDQGDRSPSPATTTQRVGTAARFRVPFFIGRRRRCGHSALASQSRGTGGNALLPLARAVWQYRLRGLSAIEPGVQASSLARWHQRTGIRRVLGTVSRGCPQLYPAQPGPAGGAGRPRAAARGARGGGGPGRRRASARSGVGRVCSLARRQVRASSARQLWNGGPACWALGAKHEDFAAAPCNGPPSGASPASELAADEQVLTPARIGSLAAGAGGGGGGGGRAPRAPRCGPAPRIRYRSQARPPTDDITTLRRILRDCRTIAVVGLSAQWHRPSVFAAKYLQQHGYRIVPVNPRCTELLGERCYASLADIPHPIDMVDVFRRSEDVLPIARDAVAIGARCLWQQIGVANLDADRLAREAGLASVMDRCVKIEHARLFGGLHWAGVNTRVISARRPV
ncbi:MAG: CoA-binding protein [Ideonella sp.]|nr:CoA-binding protein [Ideonella sp.]